MGEGTYTHRCTHGGPPRPHLIVQCSVGAMVFALETKLGWRKAIIVIIRDYVHLCIVQIGINIFAMNEHIHAGWNSSGCVTVIELVDHFVLRRLPHLSFSEDLHQYLESYGAPKLVALLGGESHFWLATN
jgi:hypothetical protein